MTDESGGGPPSDQDLARRAAQGDDAAFAEIVRRYQGPVYRFCTRTLSPADAEDVAQDTFVRAFVHRARFDPERPLLPWLLTIARNATIDRARKHAPVADADAVARAADPRSSRATEARATTRDRVELLQRHLADLPAGQRDALLLFHVEGLAYKDIAQSLDVPIGTVMTWLHRGRARLRKLVEAAEAVPS